MLNQYERIDYLRDSAVDSLKRLSADNDACGSMIPDEPGQIDKAALHGCLATSALSTNVKRLKSALDALRSSLPAHDVNIDSPPSLRLLKIEGVPFARAIQFQHAD